MKKNLVLSLSGCIFFLIGNAAWASVPYNGPELLIRNPESPAIGTISTATLGQTLVEKGKVAMEKMLIVNKDIQISNYKVIATAYKQMGYDKAHTFFLPYGITKAKSADEVEAISVEKKAGADICLITRHGKKSCARGDYTKKDVGSDRGENIVRTLTYNGHKDGKKISIRYREYINSTAVPTAANSITFDLAKSDIITFRGVKIQVLEAGKKQLKYKLLHNFED
ncbi:hypothetical protein VA7868_04262 [Vibrio aerogenes CECT 7868]|uniref:Uncharacterized protein n=1 Tax=Vibrio aerogenes CECT 7868 TaxID=1216006 RepID=A0A1M6DL91_9VIBR|nr:hypothetical protein [Vibrio aerogenes]SHI73965.1 hypothetical protein VA7868_04262 [Vibrio aerogenes CECT 7868]